VLVVEKNGRQKTFDIKIITTRLRSHESVQFNEADDVAFVEGALVFPCGRGTTLEVRFCIMFAPPRLVMMGRSTGLCCS